MHSGVHCVSVLGRMPIGVTAKIVKKVRTASRCLRPSYAPLSPPPCASADAFSISSFSFLIPCHQFKGRAGDTASLVVKMIGDGVPEIEHPYYVEKHPKPGAWNAGQEHLYLLNPAVKLLPGAPETM